MKKVTLFYLLFSIVYIGCSKEDPVQPTPTPVVKEPTVNVVDKKTKYSENQPIVLTKTFVSSKVSAEPIKIVKVNGKYHLIASYTELFGTDYDYLRSFEIDSVSGKLNENTLTFLGEYKEVGFTKSPLIYEDLNSDGFKDLFIIDHGKETPQLIINGLFPGFVNHFFYGKSDGKFAKKDISSLTDVKRFHHSATTGDIDSDGDVDLVLQTFGPEEMIVFKNNNGLTRDFVYSPNNSTGSVIIVDIDGDNLKDLISAPYIDRGSTPSSTVLKINFSGTTINSTKASAITPFGNNYGCFKMEAIKNLKSPTKKSLLYLVEGGIGDQKVFKSSDDDFSKIIDMSTIQNTYKSNGIRDCIVIDINFDGFDDIFFIVNQGENLNQRIWINKGDNTFENPTYDIDVTLKDVFVPLSGDKSNGRMKFLYYNNTTNSPSSRIIDVYTKK
jgi:hypothetical protein